MPIIDRTRPTTHKNAIIAGGYQPAQGRHARQPIDLRAHRADAGAADRSRPATDTVVFSDFRHGIFNRDTIPTLTAAIPAGAFRVADSQVASRWGNILEFQGFDLITPNEREARFALGDQDSVVRPLGLELYREAKCKTLILKLGERGMMTYRAEPMSDEDVRSFFTIDSFAERVVDAVGAGDALLAYATLALVATGTGGRLGARLARCGGRMRARRQRSGNAEGCRRQAASLRAFHELSVIGGCGEETCDARTHRRYGVQGKKRRRVAGSDGVGVVDPVAGEADWREITDVPLERYDAALVCTPDEPKIEILTYLLGHGKHVLVEKPLHAATEAELDALEALARKTGAVCYTAYNHRFEPHYVRMRDLIKSGALGRIYRCRMFYGNGTARLVRDSAWRDQGAGVLPDLGSHLLDTARFWFGDLGEDFDLVSADRFENRAPDHVVVAAQSSRPRLEFEMTLLSWRNHFTCDVLAENGTAHIESLCKWGPTTFTAPHPRSAERPAAGGVGDAGAGRSDLGARIRSLQASRRRQRTDRSRRRPLAVARSRQAFGGCRNGGSAPMSGPVVGYVGMTHLGLCSAVAAASKGFATRAVDRDAALVARLECRNVAGRRARS